MVQRTPRRFTLPGLWLLLAPLLVWGCHKPQGSSLGALALAPADSTRARLLGTLTVPSLEGTVDKAATLARNLGLPFGAADVRSLLLARTGLPVDVLDQADLRRPIGVAFLAPEAARTGAGKTPANAEAFTAAALTPRSADSAAKLIGALGTKVATRGDATQVRRPDGTLLWILPRGSLLIGSGSLEGLLAAGAHALEASRAASDDVQLRVFPDAWAAAEGTTVREALARVRQDIVTPPPGSARRMSAGAAASVAASWDALADFLADAQEGEAGLRVDTARGISLVMRGRPRDRSALAQTLASLQPYAPDATLLSGPAPDLAWVSGANDAWAVFVRRYLDGLTRAGLASAGPARAAAERLTATLTGAGSGVVRLSNGFDAAYSYDLRPSVTPDAALDAFAASVAPAALPALLREVSGPDAPTLHTRREGKLVTVDVEFASARPEMRKMMRALYGSEGFTPVVTAGGGRLVTVSGPDARNRTTRLAASPPAPADVSPELASALAESRGAHMVVYVDVLGLARPALRVAAGQDDPNAAQLSGVLSTLPGLANLHLPIIATLQGGTRLDAELRIPLATLKSAADFARPLMGLAGPASNPVGPVR